MRLGIDVDGVLANWVDGMRRHLVARGYAPEALPEPTTYAFWPEWGLTKDEFFGHWEDWAKGGGYVNLDPYPGAVAGMHWLNDAGHTLHIVTARSRTRRGISGTIDWLEKHGVPFDSLAFDSQKHCHPMDIWVEDHVENAVQIAQTWGAGTPVLMAQGWNAEHPGYITRVDNWVELVGYVMTDMAVAAALEATLAEEMAR